jgi:hypothetical protein
MSAMAPGLVRDGLAYRAELLRARVPVFHRHSIVRAEGATSVELAVIAAVDEAGKPVPGTEKEFAVDAICVGFGFQPSNEIARALGCRHRLDRRRGHLVAERDRDGRSSVSGLWIVGDSGGLGGSRVAQAGGTVAGASVARDLGREVKNPGEIADAIRTSVRAERFQDALWGLYRAPRITDQLAAADTIICRCEEIRLADVRHALDVSAGTAGAV